MIRAWRRDRVLVALALPAVAYFVVFCYIPMYGVVVAFKEYSPADGFFGGEWVGFRHFVELFQSYYFKRIVTNTVLLSLYSLFWGFWAPLIFALLVNELRAGIFRRFVQTVSYLPHFISVVVVAGMIVLLLSPNGGLLSSLLQLGGLPPVDYLSEPGAFRTIYVASSVWQQFGWGAIIYLAALAGVDPNLYEAAEIDGANRWGRLLHVTLPGIAPVAIILLIMDVGSIMSVGYEKVLLLYNPATYETADIIATFVYRRGIIEADTSFSAAVGLFNSVINLILLLTVNRIARRVSGSALW